MRLSKFLERSESNLVEILILNSERSQLKRMMPEERAKYLAGELTLTDAIKIRARGHPLSDGPRWAPPASAQVVNPQASDAEGGAQKGAA